MKKLFTVIAAMLLSTVAVAQVDDTFQFVDANGTVVADGTVIAVSEQDEFGQMAVPLYVKNTSGVKAAVSMYETIDAMPNGDWQTCAFGSCMVLRESGYSPKNIVPADYKANIQTEWMPIEGGYATWEGTLQIHVFNIVKKSQFGTTIESAGDEVIGVGPKVTVRFVYQDPSGVSTVRMDDGATPQQCYSLDGRLLQSQQRGLNVIRMSDGSVKKVLMK